MDEQTGVVSRGPDVMVSYSSQDRPQVMQFVQKLRAAGVAAWIDQGGIDGAQKWGEEIVNAIDACKTVILMISQTSMKSENIAREVMLAWENGKHFLPLCLEDAPIPKSMQYQLAGIQKIMLFQGDPEAKFVSVLRALVRLGVHVSPYYIALVSADLGEREQAIEWLNKAIEQRSAGLARLKTEARFNLLRGDPRFADLMKRAEAIPFDAQEESAEIPVVLPGPVTVRPGVPSGPLPWWRRIAWPEIFDARSARLAASQGVWAAGFLVVASLLVWLFGSSAVAGSQGMGWTNPLLIAVIYAPIAFGIQKMGRPAAIIAVSLCALGALGNLTAVQNFGKMVDSYHMAAQYQYQNPSQPVNPYLAQLESQYYGAWFQLIFSLLCAGAFTNATRGTLAYRKLVAAREAQDKQDAISREDWAAIKARIPGLSKPSASAPPASGRVATSPPPAPLRQSSRPVPVAVPPPQATGAIEEPARPEPVEHEPVVVKPEPVRLAFSALIGINAGLISWPRVAVFLVANIAGGFAFLLGRSLTSSVEVPPVYWLFAVGAAVVLTGATVAGFFLLRNVWGAIAVAALVVTILTLPLYSMLPSFAWADIGYREQFQQFVLLPFVSCFILLGALVWIVPRMQPQVLALWLAAMGTEIATSLVANLLHAMGAGEPPDVVLGGASVISALLRSAGFALVLWGGLEYRKKSSAS